MIQRDLASCGPPPVAEIFEMRVIPEVVMHEHSRKLRLKDPNHAIEMPWPDQPGSERPLSLKMGQPYTFRIAQPARHVYGRHVSPRLLRIQNEQGTVADYESCPVHQVGMAFVNIPVVYGLILRPAGEFPDEETSLLYFPNRTPLFAGGCFIPPRGELGDFYPTHVCSRCNQAYARWQEAHQPKP